LKAARAVIAAYLDAGSPWRPIKIVCLQLAWLLAQQHVPLRMKDWQKTVLLESKSTNASRVARECRAARLLRWMTGGMLIC
jgi:hypothetical protein